jgi:hypothetical protein
MKIYLNSLKSECFISYYEVHVLPCFKVAYRQNPTMETWRQLFDKDFIGILQFILPFLPFCMPVVIVVEQFNFNNFLVSQNHCPMGNPKNLN